MRTRGFSLIELLVVIGIIAVLAGMLIPSVGVVREQSRALSCRNNLRMLGLAAIQFHSESGGWCLPTAWWFTNALTAYDVSARTCTCPAVAGGAPAPHYGINMHYISGYPPGYWNRAMRTIAEVQAGGGSERIAYFIESWPPSTYYIQPPTIHLGNWATGRHGVAMNVLWFSGRTSQVAIAALKDSNLDGIVDDGYFAPAFAGPVETR